MRGDRRRRAHWPNAAVITTDTATATSQPIDGERSQSAAQTTPTAAGNSQRRRGVRSGSGGVVGGRRLGAGAEIGVAVSRATAETGQFTV